jgi:hypothetical protein
MPAIASMEDQWPTLYWSYGEDENTEPDSIVGYGVACSDFLPLRFRPIKPKLAEVVHLSVRSYEVVAETKIPLIIPVDTILLGDPIYKLNLSVDGVVEWTIDGFVITAPIFDEEGYGETYENAWDDLLSSIRDRYASLVKREQGLSPLDQKVLSELRKYLSEVTQ